MQRLGLVDFPLGERVGYWERGEPVKVIKKVISSDPVTFRVHFLKSHIASVHLSPLLIQPHRLFWKAVECALYNTTLSDWGGGAGYGEGSLEAYHATHWQERCLEERRQEAQDHGQFKLPPH